MPYSRRGIWREAHWKVRDGYRQVICLFCRCAVRTDNNEAMVIHFDGGQRANHPDQLTPNDLRRVCPGSLDAGLPTPSLTANGARFCQNPYA